MKNYAGDSRSPLVARGWILFVLLLLITSNVACGTGGLAAHRNNAIRRAVVAYELSERGPTDELLVAFGFMEVRANLGFPAGNTVWLQPVAQMEYLDHRNVNRSYIFLHRPEGEGDTATVVVDRGSETADQSYQLTLHREKAAWLVVKDVPLE